MRVVYEPVATILEHLISLVRNGGFHFYEVRIGFSFFEVDPSKNLIKFITTILRCPDLISNDFMKFVGKSFLN